VAALTRRRYSESRAAQQARQGLPDYPMKTIDQ
jgi:hypothetical protein